ncbi:hypothetical protein M409DRAFT_30269 [Zasmidium cellare ATCC 36951]|uniref:Uncharacterized protein n=1 Tax=Zasmidium cellare ATCC 36951 TaxID=1080233 RepID=A0A6A6BWQ5_ZASCE|nr:uncharacterized protein M409DRAFT_30269 [Zasmidium cellare ATCC 36951]KAF2159264.1 hypothetical protein M409DRAFT_30269 [Zasmidium cellare ATCC 36951]
MKTYTIPILTPELLIIFATTPCNDAAHQHQDLDANSPLTCPTSKTLLLRDDASFAVVHSWPFIKPGYTFRGPSKGSREVLLRMRTHGNACVPSYLPEQTRRCERKKLAEVERCRTHMRYGLEVKPPAEGEYDHEEDGYGVVPDTCQFDDEYGNLCLATEDDEKEQAVQQARQQAEQLRPRQSKRTILYEERQRRKEEEKWVVVEDDGAEEDRDWEILDREQVQEDYWEDYFEFNGCIMGAGASASM